MKDPLEKQVFLLTARMASMRTQGIDDRTIVDAALGALSSAGVSLFGSGMLADRLRHCANAIECANTGPTVEDGQRSSGELDRVDRSARIRPLLS